MFCFRILFMSKLYMIDIKQFKVVLLTMVTVFAGQHTGMLTRFYSSV